MLMMDQTYWLVGGIIYVVFLVLFVCSHMLTEIRDVQHRRRQAAPQVNGGDLLRDQPQPRLRDQPQPQQQPKSLRDHM